MTNYSEDILLPEKTGARVGNGIVCITGPKGELTRNLFNPKSTITLSDARITITFKKFAKKEKTLLGTTKAHIKNMIKGVNEPFVYGLKICSGHFPMNVTIKDRQLIVKNFIGEKTPRTLNIKNGASVNVQGDEITVESIDKEVAGMTAGAIEKLMKRPGFDRRVFQPGIYITKKP